MSTGTAPTTTPLTLDYVSGLVMELTQFSAVVPHLRIAEAFLGGWPIPLPDGDRIPTYEEFKTAWTVVVNWFAAKANEVFGREVPPPQPQQGPQQPGM